MRLHGRFPLQFWADVVDTVVYLINRGPSSSLDGGIPEEHGQVRGKILISKNLWL